MCHCHQSLHYLLLLVIQVTSFDSLITLFTNMEWCNESIAWDEEGDLRDAIRYARGSKKFRIPPEWRDALPTTIPPLQPWTAVHLGSWQLWKVGYRDASIWFPKEHCSYEIVFDRSLFSSPKKLISYEMCYPGLSNWFFSYEMFSWLAKLADVSYEMCYPGYARRCFIWTVWGNSYEFKLRFLEVIHMKRMFHMKGLG